MNCFKCKTCGGTIEFEPGATIGVCDSCGTRQTLPKTNDEAIANLFNRANNLRLKCEFDKAASIYEKIVEMDDSEAEAHWGIVLCKYGIEYVDDPASGAKIPTCHRTLYEAVTADADYQAAIDYSDTVQQMLYEAEAHTIDRIQKDILAIVKNEKPFDIFICYKETDESGKRTQDSVIANDIYYQLTEEGFKVFYAAITLEDKLGQEYEPYIFAALNSAKVMLVVGTNPMYFNAVWVKNEWSRYMKLMKTDRKKLLIPCYRDMDAYELPEEFAHLQAQDMSKIGFINDVVRGIKKVVSTEASQITGKETIVINSGVTNNASSAPILERASLFLEDEKWQDADIYYEKVLDIDPKNAEAYLGKLMVELQVKNREQLADCTEPFDDRDNYSKVLRFGDEKIEAEMREYIAHIKERKENARLTGIYNDAIKAMSVADSEEAYKAVVHTFQSISGFEDADKQVNICLQKIEECRTKEEALRLERERKAEERRIAAEKAAKKRKKFIAIATPIMCVCIAFVIVLIKVIIPNIQYDTAVSLYNEGKYAEAINAFMALNGYKDSETQIENCNSAITEEEYNAAVFLYNEGKYEEAINAFMVLNGYKDSEAQIENCNSAITEEEYNTAVFLYNEGKYEEAINAFTALNGYKESETKIKDCKYNVALALANEERYMEAYESLLSLDGYKDSVEKASEIYRQYSREMMKDADVGDTVVFGSYEQDNNTSNGKEDIEWLVLEKKDNKILVISDKALDCQNYNTSYDDVTWETCSLRKWMNDKFLNNAFSAEEQAQIQSTNVSADKNPECSTNPGNDTTDKVFLLSITEVEKYFSSDEDRRCIATEYAQAQGADGCTGAYKGSAGFLCGWWLRSPGYDQFDAAYVYLDGSVYYGGHSVHDDNDCVRPALWINLDA